MSKKAESDLNSKKIILRQSNKLSRSPCLTLRQTKVCRYFLERARKKLLETTYHRVYQEELKDFLGSNDWENLKEDIEAIRKINIRWDLLPQKGGGDKLLWGVSPVLADCELKKDESGRLYFQFSFSPKMLKELHSPKFFRDFDLRLIRSFKSKYALKFYEFCLASINPGQKHLITELIPKDTFWELLGLEEDKYKDYYDFKKRVINPAISEVNKISDLKIELIRKKIASGKYAFCFKIERQSMKTHFGFSDPKLDEVYEFFQGASIQTQESVEKEFFMEHPEAKEGYMKGERNLMFENWVLDKYYKAKGTLLEFEEVM